MSLHLFNPQSHNILSNTVTTFPSHTSVFPILTLVVSSGNQLTRYTRVRPCSATNHPCNRRDSSCSSVASLTRLDTDKARRPLKGWSYRLHEASATHVSMFWHFLEGKMEVSSQSIQSLWLCGVYEALVAQCFVRRAIARRSPNPCLSVLRRLIGPRV